MKMTVDSQKRAMASYCIRSLLMGMVVTLFVLVNGRANAGGLFIKESSLVFTQYEQQVTSGRQFDFSACIEMQFQYDCYAYAGKPYRYGVFKVFYCGQLLDTPIGYFVYHIPPEATSGIGKVRFELPEPDQCYEIRYHVVPFFDFEPLESGKFGGFIISSEERRIDRFYLENSPYMEQLDPILTTASERRVPPPSEYLTVYIKGFDRIRYQLKASQPVTFKWEHGPETSTKARHVRYSYRLHPIEDWSIFSEAQQTTYDFLRPGNYTFQVKARYVIGNIERESGVASWNFTLEKQIFGLTKGEGLISPTEAQLPARFFEAKHYNQSRALLIGVSKYEEMGTWIPLPFVREDVKMIEKVLNDKYKFTVEKLEDNTSKGQIRRKLNDFLDSSKENDRAILYFSGHGTSEKEAGFLVPTNGSSYDKWNTCISFEFLKGWTDSMFIEKKVKHLLIILDSCHSGLGVLSKSTKPSRIKELAAHPSAHMITAGLLDQDAYPYSDKRKSVFTQYLVEGLRGKADYTKDDVISVTELLVFVQDGVSKYVAEHYENQVQTPVMGKIKGAGEMLFLLR